MPIIKKYDNWMAGNYRKAGSLLDLQEIDCKSA